jgi:hypothetical protein
MVPETVAPAPGELIETAGGVVSAVALLTVMEIDELDEFPAASLAVALIECPPLDDVVVFHAQV